MQSSLIVCRFQCDCLVALRLNNHFYWFVDEPTVACILRVESACKGGVCRWVFMCLSLSLSFIQFYSIFLILLLSLTVFYNGTLSKSINTIWIAIALYWFQLFYFPFFVPVISFDCRSIRIADITFKCQMTVDFGISNRMSIAMAGALFNLNDKLFLMFRLLRRLPCCIDQLMGCAMTEGCAVGVMGPIGSTPNRRIIDNLQAFFNRSMLGVFVHFMTQTIHNWDAPVALVSPSVYSPFGNLHTIRLCQLSIKQFTKLMTSLWQFIDKYLQGHGRNIILHLSSPLWWQTQAKLFDQQIIMFN